MKSLFRMAAATALGLAALPAVAADLPQRAPAPAPVMTYEAFDPWMIRVRAIGVIPDGKTNTIVGGPPAFANSLKVSTTIVPEIDITYFFTKNIAVEAICCFSPHKISGKGPLAGVGEVGKTLVFPPTVMLQYHFTNFGAFKPYVGVGVNWTHYFRNKATGPTFSNLDIKDSFGVAAQIGFDYMINRNWGFNVDVKRIMMRPDATVVLNGAPPTPVRAKVRIDPWVVGAGVVYRFGGGSAVLARY